MKTPLSAITISLAAKKPATNVTETKKREATDDDHIGMGRPAIVIDRPAFEIAPDTIVFDRPTFEFDHHALALHSNTFEFDRSTFEFDRVALMIDRAALALHGNTSVFDYGTLVGTIVCASTNAKAYDQRR